jgi:hypothetical protein
MIRLFVPNDLSAGAGVVPTVDQSRYLTSVMRLGVGAELFLFNGRDGEWRATIIESTKRGCLLKAEEQVRPMEFGPRPRPDHRPGQAQPGRDHRREGRRAGRAPGAADHDPPDER